MIIVHTTDLQSVESLLQSCQLPISDIQSNAEIQFYGIFDQQRLIACIGLEQYGEIALIRSLAVDSNLRNQGVGDALHDHAHKLCRDSGIVDCFLLTDTASDYFRQRGYQTVTRDLAPESIQQTTQFSSLCPYSAILMKFTLKP